MDKYIGDGMMVFFGAPLHYEDHADRALAVSLEMVDRLAESNKRWTEKGEPTMDLGVGINSGPVVVGNVGSPERMDYTIIGEDVNLASRLESMNKEYKTRIILSDRTVSYLKDDGSRKGWCRWEPPASGGWPLLSEYSRLGKGRKRVNIYNLLTLCPLAEGTGDYFGLGTFFVGINVIGI